MEEEIGENVDARREITSRLTYECDESSDESRGTNWSNAELKALVEFILSHGSRVHWPTHHRMDYWNSAASFIKMRSNTSKQRSSNYYIHSILA